MGSKRNSAAGPNIEFLRADNAGKEDKCKEFWKYLDENKSLQPYQPPKFSEEAKQGTSSSGDARTTARTAGRGATYSCNKGAKPKKHVKKEDKAKKSSGQYAQYEKIFREGLELAKYDPSPEELLAEIDEYDRRMNAMYPVECPICEKVECTCSDEDTD